MAENRTQSRSNQIFDFKNPADFRNAWKWLYRVIRPVLDKESLSLFPVVEFIFDRTASWGKSWEVIRPIHFIDGIIGKEGEDRVAAGLLLHRNTVRKNLKYLIGIGLVLTQPQRRGGTLYAINANWNPNQFNSMKTPKRERTEIPEVTLESIGKIAAERTLAAKTKKQSRLTFESISGLWEITVIDILGKEAFVTPTKTNYMALFSYAKRYVKSGKTFPQFKKFLIWTIEYWQILMRDVFRWTNNTAPKVPAIGWLVKFSDKFEEAYLLYQNPIAGKPVSSPKKKNKKQESSPQTVEVEKLLPPTIIQPIGDMNGVEELPEWK